MFRMGDRRSKNVSLGVMSGAVTLADAGITLLTDYRDVKPTVGKERVFFVANNELQKLVLNALLVVYIP